MDKFKLRIDALQSAYLNEKEFVCSHLSLGKYPPFILLLVWEDRAVQTEKRYSSFISRDSSISKQLREQVNLNKDMWFLF
jgi:hypothetical protein